MYALLSRSTLAHPSDEVVWEFESLLDASCAAARVTITSPSFRTALARERDSCPVARLSALPATKHSQSAVSGVLKDEIQHDLRSHRETPADRPDSTASKALTELRCSVMYSAAATNARRLTPCLFEGRLGLASVVSDNGPGSRCVLPTSVLLAL